MGIFQAAYAIGSMAVPVVSGAIADNLGLDAVFELSAIIAMGVMVIAGHRVVRRAGSAHTVLVNSTDTLPDSFHEWQ